MDTIIIKEKTETYKHLGFHYFAELICGKHALTISVCNQQIWVCLTSNASHRVWKGMGKRFVSLDLALAAYKTAAVRSMIQTAADRYAAALPA